MDIAPWFEENVHMVQDVACLLGCLVCGERHCVRQVRRVGCDLRVLALLHDSVKRTQSKPPAASRGIHSISGQHGTIKLLQF